MTIDVRQAREAAQLVDADNGRVARKIFSDPEIYQLELEQIFGRAWLFMCHENQIARPGDYFQTCIGEDKVIVCRDRDGSAQVLLNTCRHRGNLVCRMEHGHATSFMCTYHGWTYDLKGALVGVPGFKEVYHGELDHDSWGLVKAAQVESYRGFVFATMDPAAPGLQEYLGEGGLFCIDQFADRGDLVAIDGVLKFIEPCNWKFAMDNNQDFYHVTITHASARISGWNQRNVSSIARQQATPSTRINTNPGIVVLADYGHVASAPLLPENWEELTASDPTQRWRMNPEVRQRYGKMGIRMNVGNANIFPNTWFAPSWYSLIIRQPKGPMSTEIWYFNFLDRKASPELNAAIRARFIAGLGPAGMMEQDDGDNWENSTQGTVTSASRRHDLHYGMSVGHGELVNDELTKFPRIEDLHVNEHYARWSYRAWSEWMAAEDWSDLKKNHTQAQNNFTLKMPRAESQ